MSNIDSILTEWGKWSRGGFGSLGACTSAWAANERAGSLPNISDDIALEVDRAVIALGEQDRVIRHVIELSYVRRLSVIEIGLRVGYSRNKVDKLIAEGAGFIGGRLSMFSRAA